MRRWVICFSHSRTCSAVTRSIWFQKLWEDSAAGSAGRRRVRTVWRYQSANCTLLVGDKTRCRHIPHMFILPAHRWTREQHTRRTPPRHRNPRGWHRHKKREARSCRRRAVGRQEWRRGADKATKTVACPTEVAGRGAIALFLNLDHPVRIRFSEDGEYIFRTQASASDGTAHRSQSQEQVAPAAFHSRDASRIDGEGFQNCLGAAADDVLRDRSFRQERDYQEEHGGAV